MKNKPLKRSIWYYLLGVLGFQSCVNFGGAEYGTPHATFNVDGKVRSNETEQPIADIKVLMRKYYEYSDTSFLANLDSAYTDSDGNYALSVEDFPTTQEYILGFVDIDGDQNGRFAAKDTLVKFDDNEYVGGNKSWFAGTASKTINVKLHSENEE